MAHLPQPVNAYQIFAQKYIERCKQVQKLANLHPAYHHQTFPNREKSSSVIVLDDDNTQNEANNNHSSSCHRELLADDSTTNQSWSTNLEDDSSQSEENIDLHITGVSILREWIDISELDLNKHLNLQDKNCDSAQNNSANRLDLSSKRKEDRSNDVSTTTENEHSSKRRRHSSKNGHCSETVSTRDELLNKRREDDVRVLRSSDRTRTESEDSSKKRRTRTEMRFNFEDGEDSCHEPDEDWVEMDEEEESDEVEDVLTNVKDKTVKRKKRMKVRRKRRRKSVFSTDKPKEREESESVQSPIAEPERKEGNQENGVEEEEDFFQDEYEHTTANPDILSEAEKDSQDHEIAEEKIDISETTIFHDENGNPATIPEGPLPGEDKTEVKQELSPEDKQTQPAPLNEKEDTHEENAKPEDPEVEILDDNWADINVVEVISSDEEATHKENEEKYKCDKCSYKTNWKSNLSKHIVSRHQASSEIKWFECAHCPYKGKTREYLRAHLRQSHEQFITWYDCDKCNRKFKGKQLMDCHVLSVHTPPEDIDWFRCDQCDFKCRTKARLKRHRLNKHTSEDEIKWHRCSMCKYKGKTKRSLRKHEKNKHTYDHSEWLKCDNCSYEGSNRLCLRRHVKANHPEVIQIELDDVSETQLVCNVCGVKMFSKSKFLEHFRWSKNCYF